MLARALEGLSLAGHIERAGGAAGGPGDLVSLRSGQLPERARASSTRPRSQAAANGVDRRRGLMCDQRRGAGGVGEGERGELHAHGVGAVRDGRAGDGRALDDAGDVVGGADKIDGKPFVRHVIRIDPKVGALHEDTIELDEEGLAAWQAAEDARLEMCRAKGWKANRRKPPKPRLDVYLGPPKKQVQRPGGRRAGVPGPAARSARRGLAA